MNETEFEKKHEDSKVDNMFIVYVCPLVQQRWQFLQSVSIFKGTIICLVIFYIQKSR